MFITEAWVAILFNYSTAVQSEGLTALLSTKTVDILFIKRLISVEEFNVRIKNHRTGGVQLLVHDTFFLVLCNFFSYTKNTFTEGIFRVH